MTDQAIELKSVINPTIERPETEQHAALMRQMLLSSEEASEQG
jgi:hypothetical protein